MFQRSRFTIPIILLAIHLVALVFGLIGILVMLPNPELWNDDPRAVRIFEWSMENAGATHIVLGALAMLAFGVVSIGWIKTGIFFGVSFILSIMSELFGTGTGWPFGNYEYTSFLGYKVMDRVPYTIPLSWFYVGFASFMLATVLARRFRLGNVAVWSVVIGAWLLTVWDLVLDPAMAHESLLIQFWVWDETGPYFGMPIKNFIGWSVTGVVFMAVSRWIWGEDIQRNEAPMWFPYTVYATNLAFAIVLSAAVSLWIPILLSIILGLIPATLALPNVSFRLPARRREWQLTQDA
jgi:uncharacterized membrane protein